MISYRTLLSPFMYRHWRWYSAGFPSALDAEFRQCTAGLEPHEVPLFGALQHSFEALTADFLIDVLHGTASQVTFHAGAPWHNTSGAAQCELCDLLIVTFRANPFVARVTCLQNKADKKIGGVPKTFAADMIQLDLLHGRRDIAGVGTFQPPTRLLSGALLASVASYGVFYRDQWHDYSMAYRIAAELSPPTSAKGQRRRIGDLLGPTTVRTIEGQSEVIGAPSTYLFAAHLAALRIGTPLHGAESKMESKGYRTEVRRWLRALAAARLSRASGAGSGNSSRGLAASAFIAATGGDDNVIALDADDGPTVVLIQTDGRTAMSG